MKSYQQYCGLARALDVVGQRWTLLLVRELMLGPKRYKELLEANPGLTTNLLARRLKEMVAHRLLDKDEEGRYRLTELGRALEAPIRELGRWGRHRMQTPEPEDRRDPGWALFSLKRRYGGGLKQIATLTVVDTPRGVRNFVLYFKPDRFEVEEAELRHCPLHLEVSQQRFFEIFFGRQDVPEAWRELVASFRPLADKE